MICAPDDPDSYDDDDADCHACGGEGVVANCFEPFACMHPDEGCDLCMRRCEWCATASTTQAPGYEEVAAEVSQPIRAESNPPSTPTQGADDER